MRFLHVLKVSEHVWDNFRLGGGGEGSLYRCNAVPCTQKKIFPYNLSKYQPILIGQRPKYLFCREIDSYWKWIKSMHNFGSCLRLSSAIYMSVRKMHLLITMSAILDPPLWQPKNTHQIRNQRLRKPRAHFLLRLENFSKIRPPYWIRHFVFRKTDSRFGISDPELVKVPIFLRF